MATLWRLLCAVGGVLFERAPLGPLAVGYKGNRWLPGYRPEDPTNPDDGTSDDDGPPGGPYPNPTPAPPPDGCVTDDALHAFMAGERVSA